jgi:hypothetical protein
VAEAAEFVPPQDESFEPTPTPAPSVQPTPTPSLVSARPPLSTREEAQVAVFAQVSACASEIAASAGDTDTVSLFFDAAFNDEDRAWFVDVTTGDAVITFGRWRLNEGALTAAQPVDGTATALAGGAFACGFPLVLLDGAAAPPLLSLRINPDAVDQAPVDAEPEEVIGSSDLAAMRVWSGLYSCSQDFPSLGSFIARADVGGIWLVEGRTEVTSYGLWEVEALTGDVRPRDDRARQVSASCGTTPIVLTGSQATARNLRSRDCFQPFQ